FDRAEPPPAPRARQRRAVDEPVADRHDPLRAGRRPDVPPGEVLGGRQVDVDVVGTPGRGQRRGVVVDHPVGARGSALTLDERLEGEREGDETRGDRRCGRERDRRRTTPEERGRVDQAERGQAPLRDEVTYESGRPTSHTTRSARRAVSVCGWRPLRTTRTTVVTIPSTSSAITTIPAARPSVHAAPSWWRGPVMNVQPSALTRWIVWRIASIAPPPAVPPWPRPLSTISLKSR